jgi:hypothetical protein
LDEADHSSDLMMELFPELLDSPEFFFSQPSKKAMRRFPAVEPMPRQLSIAMRAERILDDRIRSNVAEVADVTLRIVPSLLHHSKQPVGERGRAMRADCPSHFGKFLSVIMMNRGISDERAARGEIIRQVLFQGSRRQSLRTRADGEANLAVVASRGSRSKQSGKANFPLPGVSFWEANHAPSYPDLLAPSLAPTHDSNTTFWIRQ